MKLLDKFQEAKNDPELLSLREALAITKVRTYELLDRVDSGESAERWKLALEAWDKYKSAKNTRHEHKAFAHLEDVMEGAFHDYMSWKQIFDIFELERKLSEGEQKRLVAMQQMITAEDVARLVSNLQAAIITVIDDGRLLKKLEYEFVRLAGIGASGGASGSEQAESIIEPSDLDTGEFLDSRA